MATRHRAQEVRADQIASIGPRGGGASFVDATRSARRSQEEENE